MVVCERDEHNAGPAVAGALRRPIEHLGFYRIGERLPLFALLGAVRNVAAFRRECVRTLSSGGIQEFVVILGLDPIEEGLLEGLVLEGNPPLDEIPHELVGVVGPFATELRPETTLGGLLVMATIRGAMGTISVKFWKYWIRMVPTP